MLSFLRLNKYKFSKKKFLMQGCKVMERATKWTYELSNDVGNIF